LPENMGWPTAPMWGPGMFCTARSPTPRISIKAASPPSDWKRCSKPSASNNSGPRRRDLISLCGRGGKNQGKNKMAAHLYFVPVVPGPKPNTRYPKYVTTYENWSADYYGYQPYCFTSVNLDDATDQAIANNADVQRLPDNLDQPIGTQGLSIF